jgi:hypothetical protein
MLEVMNQLHDRISRLQEIPPPEYAKFGYMSGRQVNLSMVDYSNC